MYIEPKINWVDGDKFNLTPDYDRIKSNIEHTESLYGISGVPLGSYTLTDVPTSDFYNNIHNNIKLITDGTVALRKIKAYDLVWSAKELNTIEGACKGAYDNYQANTLICNDGGYCDDNTLL